MIALKILAFVFLVPGFLLVFLSRWATQKFRLDKKMTCDYENEMTEEEVAQYKVNRAVVNLKMVGMLIALPGLIMVIIAFK